MRFSSLPFLRFRLWCFGASPGFVGCGMIIFNSSVTRLRLTLAVSFLFCFFFRVGLHYRLLASRGGTTSGRSVNSEKVGEFITGRHPPIRRLGEVYARWGDAVAEVP